MLTLTQKEFESIHRRAEKTYLESVYGRLTKMRSGCECESESNRIDELYLYLWILNRWEMVNYQWVEFNNCITPRDVYNIYQRILKLVS